MMTKIAIEVKMDCGLNPLTKEKITMDLNGELWVKLPDIFGEVFDTSDALSRKMSMDAVAAYLYSLERDGEIGTIDNVRYMSFERTYDSYNSLLKTVNDVVVEYDHKLIKEICEETGVNSVFEVFLRDE